MKVAVGMSGGVDSSVAALLLKQEGHEVLGVTMKIWRAGAAPGLQAGNTCYGPEEESEVEEARAVCTHLGIVHETIDCAESYERIVLDYFKAEYRAGRTPNPCIRCNQEIKFGLLPRLVKDRIFTYDKFATGHYARAVFDAAAGRYRLWKGVEPRKDQSYFLYRLSQEQLATVMFPLGLLRKDEVRRLAREAGIAVHDKPESQDFCSGDYAAIMAGEPGAGEGDIIDSSGTVLGRHRGIWRYTIGQRKGLGIAWTEPLYVLGIDAANNRLIVGTGKEIARRAFIVQNCTWSGSEVLREPVEVKVKIRSTSPETDARVEPGANNEVRVTFSAPQPSITPGQSAVFYDGDCVLGGGIIDRILT